MVKRQWRSVMENRCALYRLSLRKDYFFHSTHTLCLSPHKNTHTKTKTKIAFHSFRLFLFTVKVVLHRNILTCLSWFKVTSISLVFCRGHHGGSTTGRLSMPIFGEGSVNSIPGGGTLNDTWAPSSILGHTWNRHFHNTWYRRMAPIRTSGSLCFNARCIMSEAKFGARTDATTNNAAELAAVS